ncbi:glycosyltransferase [Desulfopila sp. IMCC35006]|uniref:glycosyltransferase n=1 Tax=Desulfopila sp. IMCC35006 TaxID=2569542 RepID=UPI0010ACA77A|nr:glycosyltransferase [Desulfopila sp. IMCC35006]TKB23961.1 glycosyltransferase [Desulfopila sp. IMCC35006]
MKVNILYLIQYLGHGGTEKQLVQLIRGLDRSCFQPHLCTLKPSEGYFEELSIPKICLQFGSFSHFSMLPKVAQLSSFIRLHNIHIVQTFFQDPFLLAAMVKPLHKIRLLGSFRDLGFWRTPAATCKMRIAYPFFSGFIANSQAVKEHFVQTDRIRPDRIEVIYNGFELGSEGPRPSEGATFRFPLVGIVANCNRQVKRVHDFIHAAALVHRNLRDVRFIVVGDGPQRPLLEELGRTLGLADVLTFTGRVATPLDFIRNFSVGVIASETEGFCNAILEYMACGVPVVATATGGNPELVREGENGFLVPVGDVVLMAKKIEQFLMQEPLHAKVAEANLARVADDFSLSRMIARHKSYYDQVMEN